MTAATTTKTGSLQALRQSQKARFRITLAFKYLIAAIVLVYSLFPIIWTISASFSPTGSISGQSLIPDPPTLRNYERILAQDFWTWMWNSFKISSISALLAGVITLMAAYAFSRFRWRGRSQLLLVILLIQVFPAILAMVALFAILQQIGNYIPFLGLNTHGGLILIYMGGTLGVNVWLMKGFFDSVPREIDESGKVDGASDWQIFWRLLFPLVRPIMVVSMILTFFGTYSDYLMPRIMITTASKFTLMLGLQTFIGANYAQEWGSFAAGAVMGAIPMVAVYLLLQDYIVGGLTAGAVKG
ncbi:putative maltose transporter subunit; membrane component of ABC superfamily [Candidatus Promineifilum breve]|uniref:Maltose transporter subunit membrane component of ABC superfamily n=1 Tax=Candidatus Promineifilum breve TaxID=1806508 RepID=A0A160T641_9CHLR|nr:sugar ABC transporter permease [Candidatus Promineifilum breve]CUS04425.2 putative maltose transporter subunit; membrane component of ABC superfamily [Candidatus Promineifilum breve]